MKESLKMDRKITKKVKRKRKPESISSKDLKGDWNACDVDTESVFSNGTSVDGFLGLEELNEYNEDDIKALASVSKKKRNKQNDQDLEDLEETLSKEPDCSDMPSTDNGAGKNLCEDVDKKVGEDVADSNATKEADKAVLPNKLSKKERRKLARKMSFKLKLKERRKKRKEMKRGKEKPEEECIAPIPETEIKKSHPVDSDKASASDMSEWYGLGVPDEVLKALAESNFSSPTEIQKESLPQAILYRKDVIGAAETGSGKTLAFGIPLIKNISDHKQKILRQENEENSDDQEDPPLYALIISPTRELALQIKDHIDHVAKYTEIKCVALVGGLACAKQERLLSKCPEIVVGTPGRLHKLLMDGCEHLNKLDTLKFVVIDEADRMLEQGHFKELNDILDMIGRVKVKRQYFVFSATLTLPQHHKNYKGKKKNREGETETQQLIDKIGLNQKAVVIDLTPKHATASQLTQWRILCTQEEKVMYLIYFLLTNPGRSIVFVNSIAYTRKLCSLLTLLSYSPLPLHAGKQQRQRLKYLDRFTASENGLLIATDVAARGLDIPKVCNVIHFQLPKDPKIYIHRSGRTARAKETGTSFILQGPEDFPQLKKITNVLKLGKDIPMLNVDRKTIEGIKRRVTLARDIDREENSIRQLNSDAGWLKKSAASMDIEVEEMEENKPSKNEEKQLKAKKKQLQILLSEELHPSGLSVSYPTQNGNFVYGSLRISK